MVAGASLLVVTAGVELPPSLDESVVAGESQLSEPSVVLDVLDESAGVVESAPVVAEALPEPDPVVAAALTVTSASLAVTDAAGLLVAWPKLWFHIK